MKDYGSSYYNKRGDYGYDKKDDYYGNDDYYNSYDNKKSNYFIKSRVFWKTCHFFN